jgi:hypothetical protein
MMRVGLADAIALAQIAVVVGLMLASELGLRAGLRRSAKDAVLDAQVGIAQATSFAILGLLAAFTISMAEARFSGRRQLILEEANAIETAALRSRYLAEPHAAELAPVFRRYVDARVAFHDARDDLGAIASATELTERLQAEVWRHAIALAREDPTHGDTVASFEQAVTEMIALERERVASLYMRVPPTLVLLVVVVGLFACAATGYASGLAGRRVWVTVNLLPLLVGAALAVLIDLDSPRVGLIETGQGPMTRLQGQLAADPWGAR